MERETSKQERAVRPGLTGPGRAVLDCAVEAMSAGADSLADLGAALDAGRENPQPELMIATTAILEAGQAAGEFLSLVAAANAGRRVRTKYRVTCPECGAKSMTEWTNVLPPDSVSPVKCSA